MGTNRSEALHNFSMPRKLRWAKQRHLRCRNVGNNLQIAVGGGFAARDSGASDEAYKIRIQKLRMVSDNTEASKRAAEEAKLNFNVPEFFLLANDALKDVPEEGEVSVPPQLSPQLPNHAAESSGAKRNCSWNLRKRRDPCLASENGIADGKGLKVDSPRHDPGVSAAKSPNHRGNGRVEKSKRPKFSLSLSKKEIEEDYFNIFNRRLPAKPKKRPKAIQKNLDGLFPGLYLTEVTPSMYEVPKPTR
ncbi:uncharacterized protein LOC127261414 [Andrographis paniculata]|uniref:uncharacterized protein LOC127261414 n=1 Tax=Andrographis paniculata TaxID=175694 RepID=UPI0021E87D29|nr:uncharacterized protein LOC127261414 [Andrographis paniculata]